MSSSIPIVRVATGPFQPSGTAGMHTPPSPQVIASPVLLDDSPPIAEVSSADALPVVVLPESYPEVDIVAEPVEPVGEPVVCSPPESSVFPLVWDSGPPCPPGPRLIGGIEVVEGASVSLVPAVCSGEKHAGSASAANRRRLLHWSRSLECIGSLSLVGRRGQMSRSFFARISKTHGWSAPAKSARPGYASRRSPSKSERGSPVPHLATPPNGVSSERCASSEARSANQYRS